MVDYAENSSYERTWMQIPSVGNISTYKTYETSWHSFSIGNYELFNERLQSAYQRMNLQWSEFLQTYQLWYLRGGTIFAINVWTLHKRWFEIEHDRRLQLTWTMFDNRHSNELTWTMFAINIFNMCPHRWIDMMYDQWTSATYELTHERCLQSEDRQRMNLYATVDKSDYNDELSEGCLQST